jgi:NAD(P)-dependent dehydrogenase (short-subunit alcohol dehydrogenase family)
VSDFKKKEYIMSNRFEGKVALVTGGGSGIGQATALQFAAEGAKVVIGNRNEAKGLETVKQINDAGGTASFLRTDVTREADIQALINHATSEYGGLHAAFNNAGIEDTPATTVENTEENYNRVFDVNVKGVLLSMKHEIDYMLNHGGGAIVNNASIAGFIGFPQHGVYVASKHAVLGLTKTAALEYGAQGVVNAVSPGGIKTDLLDRICGETEAEQQQMMEHFTGLHPIGRIGESREISGAVLWLCSDEASFMLGQSITVDGGYTAI